MACSDGDAGCHLGAQQGHQVEYSPVPLCPGSHIMAATVPKGGSRASLLRGRTQRLPPMDGAGNCQCQSRPGVIQHLFIGAWPGHPAEELVGWRDGAGHR
jgi:hypothetical protein